MYATDQHAQNMLTKLNALVRISHHPPPKGLQSSRRKESADLPNGTSELVFIVKVDKLVDKTRPLKGETASDSRLSALKSQLAEPKSLIFQGGNESDSQKRKSKAEGELSYRTKTD
jgi:hypothetical protein